MSSWNKIINTCFLNFLLIFSSILISATASAEIILEDYSSLKDHSSEIIQYQKDCENNQADACEKIGWYYLQGFTVAKDFAKSKNFLNKAVKLKNTQAIIDLGLLDELDNNINFTAAKEHYEQASKLGNPDANFYLARLYYQGYGVAKDKAKALSLVTDGCKNGSSLSCIQQKKLSYNENYTLNQEEIKEILEEVKQAKNSLVYGLGSDIIMEFGPNDEQTFEQIYNLAKEGCLLEDGISCGIIGLLHSDPIDSLRNMISNTLTEPYYRKSCSLNYALGCGSLATLLSNSNKTSEANDYLKKACLLNNKFSCDYISSDQFEKESYDEAYYFSQRGCILNSDESCNRLGLLYGNGLGTTKNYDEALVTFIKGCDLENSTACLNVGNIYFKETFPNYSLPKNVKKGEEFIQKSCDMNNIDACNSLANYFYNTNLEEKRSKIKSLYKNSCNLGSVRGCISLLQYEEDLKVSEKDQIKIVNNLDIFCKSEKYDACMVLGQYYQFNNNKDKALSYLKIGCNGGNTNSCEKLAVYQLSEPGSSEQDIKEALNILNKNCDEKASSSCLVLGKYYQETDNNAAEQYLIKSCKLDNQEGCFEIFNNYLSKIDLYSNDENFIPEIPSKEVVQSTQKLCELGNSNGCEGMSIFTYYGLGLEKNTNKGLEGLRTSCDNNSYFGCAFLAYIYTKEKNNEHQKEIIPLFEKSCNLGYAIACNLAFRYLDNTDKSPNKEIKLITYLQSGCKLGNELSCFNLADMYKNEAKYQKKETGLIFKDFCLNNSYIRACMYIIFQNDHYGLNKDSINEINTFIDQSCQQENVQACTLKAEYNLNILFKNKNEDNALQALNLLELSCDKGYAPACTDLISLYSSDTYVDHDEAKLQSSFNRACKFGNSDACNNTNH